MTSSLKITLVVLTAAQALIFDDRQELLTEPSESNDYSWTQKGDHIDDNSHRDSKPGTPVLPDWKDNAITAANLVGEWRAELGERVVKAADAHDSIEKCESFISMGDFSWCRKAMPKEVSPAFKQKFRGVHEYNLSKHINIEDAPSGDSFLALSFGVEAGDLWSNLMSSLYYVKSELFDCYYDGPKGPLVHDLHAGFSRSKPCQSRDCYTEDYKANRICLNDASNETGVFTDIHHKKHQSLFSTLEGRKPLSTFVKMDVEGSEWPVLERLLENEEQMAKIRTLDMEVHFNMEPTVVKSGSKLDVTSRMPTKESLTHHVEIMEKLAKKFAVTGSTLEHHTEALIQSFKQKRSVNPHFVAPGGNIFTKNGINIDQYCISFINRELL